jgi:lactoylglutathione lyase
MGKLSAPRLTYTGLRVRDMKRSIEFYTKALDMELQFRFNIKETGGKVAYLKSPGGKHTIELNWYPGSTRYRRGDELDHLGFKVPDLRAVHEKLIAHGARVTIGTFNEGSVKLTFYEDPDGVPIEIASSRRGRFRVKGGALRRPPRAPEAGRRA